MSLNRPLHIKVSLKVEREIISNQYIDMQEILDEPSYTQDDILPFGMNRVGQVGVSPTKKIKEKIIH